MKEIKLTEDQLSLAKGYGVLAFIFLFDLFVPLGIFGGVPYVIGMIAVMWLLKPQEILVFGVFCGILALGGFFSEDISAGMEGLMNRFMAIFTIVAIAWLIRKHTDTEEEYKERQQHLASVIDKRTSGLKQIVDQAEEYKLRLGEAEELGQFGFWEYSPAVQRMSWSDGVYSIYGAEPSQQSPSLQDFIDQCHVEDLEVLERSIQYGLTERKSYVVEYRLVMPDGSLKWIYNRGRPVLNDDGEVDVLVGTIQDITLRKQSEETVVSNRARYTTLFRSASVAKVLMVPNSKILEVNRAFCDWIGYSERELLKMPFEGLIHEDDRSAEDIYAGYLMGGENNFLQREKRFVRKDGSIVWGLFSVAAVFDSSDQITCHAVEVIDLTAKKQVEESLQKAEDKRRNLEESLAESEAARRKLEGTPDARKQASEKKSSPVPFTPPSQRYTTPPAPPIERPIVPPPERAPMPPPETPYRDSRYDEIPGSRSLYVRNPLDEPSSSPDFYEEEIFGGDSYVDQIRDHPNDVYKDPPSVRAVYSEPDSFEEDESMDIEDVVEDMDEGEGYPAAPAESMAREASFEMAEEVIDQLFQLSDGLMAIIGDDGFYKRLSPALNKALGYQEGVLEDQHFLHFVHQDDLDNARVLLDRLFSGESIDGARFRHRCHDATFEWFTWNATYNQEHEVVYSVFYAAPEEKNVRKPKRRANTDWRRLTDKMPFQIWMIDTERSCRYANKKVRDFTGLPFEQLEGTGWSKAIHPDHHRNYMAYVNRHFDLREPMQYTYRMKRSDGIYRWMQETSVPLFDQDDAFEGYLVTCMDVSNVRAVENKFGAALEDALKLGNLTDVLRPCRRDECNSALTDSVKIADALIEYAGEVRHPDLAMLMEQAGLQLLDTVNGLLNFRDLESKGWEEDPGKVSLKRLIEQVVERLDTSSVHFDVSVAGADVIVSASEKLFGHALEDVLRRVVEFARDGQVSIEAEGRNESGEIVVRGVDVPINDDFFDRMSDLYRDNNNSPQIQRKAGLELSLAGRLVDMMGGSLTVDNRRNSGAALHMEFPLIEVIAMPVPEPKPRPETSPPKPALKRSTRVNSKPESANLDHELETEKNASTQPRGRRVKIQEVVDAIENMSRKEHPAVEESDAQDEDILIHDERAQPAEEVGHRILVGETDEKTQRLVKSVLQSYYDVTIASDTNVLLKQSSVKYDLLLMDIQVQGDHYSLEVLRELRQRPQYRHTPIIAFVSDLSNVDQYEVMGYLGFDSFLAKPVSFVELLESVEKLLDTGSD